MVNLNLKYTGLQAADLDHSAWKVADGMQWLPTLNYTGARWVGGGGTSPMLCVA